MKNAELNEAAEHCMIQNAHLNNKSFTGSKMFECVKHLSMSIRKHHIKSFYSDSVHIQKVCI